MTRARNAKAVLLGSGPASRLRTGTCSSCWPDENWGTPIFASLLSSRPDPHYSLRVALRQLLDRAILRKQLVELCLRLNDIRLGLGPFGRTHLRNVRLEEDGAAARRVLLTRGGRHGRWGLSRWFERGNPRWLNASLMTPDCYSFLMSVRLQPARPRETQGPMAPCGGWPGRGRRCEAGRTRGCGGQTRCSEDETRPA